MFSMLVDLSSIRWNKKYIYIKKTFVAVYKKLGICDDVVHCLYIYSIIITSKHDCLQIEQ